MTPREPSESQLAPGDVWRSGQGRSKLNAAAFNAAYAAGMLNTEPYPYVEKPRRSKRHKKTKHEPHPLTLAQRKKILAKRIAARGKK